MKDLKDQVKELQSLKDELIEIGDKIAWEFADLARSIKGVEYNFNTKNTSILGFEFKHCLYRNRGWSLHKESVLKFTGGFSEELVYYFTIDGKVSHVAFKIDDETGKEIPDDSKSWDSTLSDKDIGLRIFNDILGDIC